ncbi:MAG: hypothetical protein KKF56_04825 [Nanoarchaeota archaeon]|nr:hypothetical protein [Nanoarchaeota archaeon]
MTDEKYECSMIFEMIGKPKEHIEKTMGEFMESLGSEKGVEIKEKNIAEVKPYKDSDLFSTFADVNLECNDVNVVVMILFKYMPSHIEVVKPTSLRIDNFSLNNLFNDVMKRLHQYDEIAKTVTFERNMLINRLKEVDPDFEKVIQERIDKKVEEQDKKSKKKN